MKKINLVFLLLFTILLFSTSCTNPNNNSGNKEKQKTYTVMLYGAGGGNLDEYLLNDMTSMEKFFKSNDVSQVNVTAQFNLSSPYTNEKNETIDYQQDPKKKGTIRGYISKDGFIRDNDYTELQILHNPGVLTDFIKYSKENFTAEKYILILYDHGLQFSILDQPVDSEVTKVNGNEIFPSKAVICDNNNGNQTVPLSIFGKEEGIKNSGVKMELIYFYSCLMGQIENLYQLRNQTNYTLSSGNVTYASDLGKFLRDLCDFDDLTEAMNQYMITLLSEWIELTKNDLQTFLDVSFSDMSKWDNFITAFIKVKDALIKKYFSTPLSEEEKVELVQKWAPHIEQITMQKFTEAQIPEYWKNGQMYFYDFVRLDDQPLNEISYMDIDLSSSFKTLSQGDEELTLLVNDMEKGLDELLIHSKTHNKPDYLSEIKSSVGLLFVTKSDFTSIHQQYKKYNTLESVYTQLDWDKTTKWSDFIKHYDVE